MLKKIVGLFILMILCMGVANAGNVTDITINYECGNIPVAYEQAADNYFSLNSEGYLEDLDITSSDLNIVSIADNGFTMIGKGVGDATITVQPKPGHGTAQAKTFKVYVYANNKACVGESIVTLCPCTDDDNVPFLSESVTDITVEDPSIVTVTYDPGCSAGEDNITLTGESAGKTRLVITTDGGTYYVSITCHELFKTLILNDEVTITTDDLLDGDSIYRMPYFGSIDYPSVYELGGSNSFDVDYDETSVTFAPDATGLYLLDIWNEDEDHFGYCIKVVETIPIEEIIIDRRANFSVGYSHALLGNFGYYHVNPEGADLYNVTLTSNDLNIAKVTAEGDNVFTKAYGKTTIKIASKDNPNISADLELYSVANQYAFVGNRYTYSVPGHDDEGNSFDAEDVVSITSEDPNIFTVDYTSGGEAMTTEGVTAGVSKLKIKTNDDQYHYCTIESFASIKDGQVNQKWSMTYNDLKNVKNMNGYPYDGGAIKTAYCLDITHNESYDLTCGKDGISFTPEKAGLYYIDLGAENDESFTYYINVIDGIPVTSITLDKTSAKIVKGNTLQLTATVKPDNATNKDVIWVSANKKVATVDDNGKVKAVGKGKAFIFCVSESYPTKIASCTITVYEGIAVKSVSLSEKKLYMNAGEKERLYATINPENATKKGVKWYSSDSSIAYVSQIGKVYAKGRGTATITVVTDDGNKKATCKVYVSQPVKSVKLNKNKEELFLGETDKLVATVLPEDANIKTVKWSTSDSSIVSVAQNGQIKAKGLGTATITVITVDGGYTATCKVKVVQPVTGVKILNTGVTIKKGASKQLTAVVLPTNAQYKDVIWSSSNTNILKVNQKGKITGVKSGTAYVTVTTVDGGYKDKVAVYVKY